MSNSNTEHLRLRQAADYLNISTTTLWRLGERDPNFPRKIRIGQRLCFYRKSELDEWLHSQESTGS